MGLAASQHMESSWTRDQTCVPYIGRQILIPCATREVLTVLFLRITLKYSNKHMIEKEGLGDERKED